MDRAKTTAKRNEKHLRFVIWRDLYKRFDGILLNFTHYEIILMHTVYIHYITESPNDGMYLLLVIKRMKQKNNMLTLFISILKHNTIYQRALELIINFVVQQICHLQQMCLVSQILWATILKANYHFDASSYQPQINCVTVKPVYNDHL